MVKYFILDTNEKCGKTGGIMELARISIGEIKMINIEKGKTIFISGGNTRKKYLEIICEKDYERVVVW
jgi:hypothetical protein